MIKEDDYMPDYYTVDLIDNPTEVSELLNQDENLKQVYEDFINSYDADRI